MKILLALAFAVCAAAVTAADTFTSDIVVYGGSPAALSAAVQAKRMGATCIVVCPDRRIGGLTTGGLGQTDIGNKSAFGGIAVEFYRDIARHYADHANWKWQKPAEYRPDGQCAGSGNAETMWTFEPSAALKVLEGWEKRDGLTIHRGRRLDRTPGKVRVEGQGMQRRIVSFLTEDGTTYRGKVFVDATYEGDLMAAAGVSYTVGREGNDVYSETVNGIQRRQGHHKFEKGVSAYVVEGDPSSGLLPFVEPDDVRPDGSGDNRVQAYCFRMCLTDVPENRIPFKKPAGYKPLDYELLIRNLVAQEKAHPEWQGTTVCWKGMPWIDSRMPNRKTDANNRSGFSTDFIGQNHRWPDADYEERERILRAHLAYQQGLMWTLANDPRVPARIRNEFARWGTCRDEFADGLGDGWQRQLYVREARRMKGAYVMTERHCRWGEKAPHPVAMAAYQLDSHHCRRYVDANGFVQNEGDVEVPTLPDGKTSIRPYGIDYGSLTPKRAECVNLLVPVCISASHMAYGSIRMEPVFFALGQAAGTAASMAAQKGLAVQDVPYDELARRLHADGQVFGPVPPPAYKAKKAKPYPPFSRKRLFPGFDGKLCKVQPSIATDGKGLAILGYQKLLLTGSDVFFGQYLSKSTDGGETWSDPKLMEAFKDTHEDGLRVTRYATVYYSRVNRRWYGLGQACTYKGDSVPNADCSNGKPYSWPLFANLDPVTATYSEGRPLDFPLPYAGCLPFGQQVEEPNGDILVPFYYEPLEKAKPSNDAFLRLGRIVVARCRFEGDMLKIVQTGRPVACDGLRRGVGEPSLVRFGQKVYMTVRSDEAGMWCESDDGLNYTAPRRWTWTDGVEIGNRNTQQHWMWTGDTVYLAYTRETPANGHVFRNRAPVFLAAFDPIAGGLVRETEIALVPELGARLGNFCCAPDGKGGSWLVTAEWMQPAGCEKYGSDNSLWLIRPQ